jgi:hypothetical protein
MIEDILTFLEGWNIETITRQYSLGVGQSTSESLNRLGWLVAGEAVTTDEFMQLEVFGDEFSLTLSPNFLYTHGLTQPNPNFPYLTVYNPVSGTSGNFVSGLSFARPLPLKRNLQFNLSLGTQSTQQSASIFLQFALYSVYDIQLFLKSWREFNQTIKEERRESSLLGRRITRPLAYPRPVLTEEEQLDLLR